MADSPVRASAQAPRIDEIEYRLNALPVEKRARDGTRLSPSNVEIMFEREQLQADVRFLLEVARGRQQAEQERPVCRVHNQPKRAHYFCQQCRQAGERIVGIPESVELAERALEALDEAERQDNE
jgi:hypothetical protein